MFGSKKTAKNGTADPKPETVPQAAAPEVSSAISAAANASPPQVEPSAGAPPVAEASVASAEAQQRAGQVIRQALAFTQVVTVLMRSPHYKHFALTDLEWFVLPPILTGQYCVAEVKKDNTAPGAPAAVALWASVSPEVDKRLSENPSVPIRLRPDEWRSGEVLWLIAVIGDPRVVPQMLKNLGEATFKGREVRTRGRSQDGKPNVTIVRVSADGAGFAQSVLSPAMPS